MKFTLLLILGFCVFAAQGNELLIENKLDDELFALNGDRTIQDIIDAIIEFARNAVSAIINGAEQTVKKLHEAVEKLVQEARNELEKIREKIEQILEELSEQGEVARECVKEQRERIQKVIDKFNNGLQNCALNASNQVNDLEERIAFHVETIIDQIIEIRHIVRDCFNEREKLSRPKGAISCIIAEASEIRQRIEEAFENARQAIQTAAETLPQISTAAHKCTLAVVFDAAKELQQIVADIRKCIINKNSNALN